MPAKDGKRIKDKMLALISKVEDDEMGDEWELVALIDPGSFKLIDTLIQSELKGKGKVETLSFAAVEGDERIE